MRTSVIVAIAMIALVGFAIRAQRRHSAPVYVVDVAHAQPAAQPEGKGPPKPPPQKGGKQVIITRGPQSPPIWKTEVTGDFQTTADAARQDALKKAAEQLREYMAERVPEYRFKPTPKYLTDNRMIDEVPPEEEILNKVPGEPTMYRQKVTLELRDEQLTQLLSEDRQVRSVDRLWYGGRILGGIVVALLALIGYVRLDDWTKGYFSLALKFTALTLAVAGVVLLWWLV
jgi:hypothetical protein